MWYTYILQCSDNSYYIGHTDDLAERVKRHNAGRAAKWTACRLPVSLVYKETFTTKEQATKRELQIKKWSRAKKEALVAGDTKKLKALAKRYKISNPAQAILLPKGISGDVFNNFSS